MNYVKDYLYITAYIKRKDLPDNYLHSIAFIFYNQFIISITDTSGNILYENTNPVEELKEINSEEDLIKKEKLVFGEDYISITEQNSKGYLIKKGLEHIEPDLKEQWISFVERNIPYRVDIIKATISMLEKINLGMSFYDAEIKVYREEFNLSGIDTGEVDSAVLHFCKLSQKREYLDYLVKAKDGTLFESEPKNSTKTLRKQAIIKKMKQSPQ